MKDWLITYFPTFIKAAKKLAAINLNSIKIGIIEYGILLFIIGFVDNTILRKMRLNNDPDEFYIEISLYLFLPIINLLFKNHRALLGNVIGFPVGLGVINFIAVAFLGYKG